MPRLRYGAAVNGGVAGGLCAGAPRLGGRRCRALLGPAGGERLQLGKHRQRRVVEFFAQPLFVAHFGDALRGVRHILEEVVDDAAPPRVQVAAVAVQKVVYVELG